jgi:ABC-type uncharacterized transport system auxiliary subunit
MTPNQPRRQPRRRSLLVALTAAAVLAGCGSDALVPDVSDNGNNDTDQPPATDTRTTDPPTASNLPVTSEP